VKALSFSYGSGPAAVPSSMKKDCNAHQKPPVMAKKLSGFREPYLHALLSRAAPE
jgi:hypothetical protein